MARKFPKSKSLERIQGNESPKCRIHIICEGSVTEPKYLRDFSRHHKNHAVEIAIHPKGGGVRTLVGKVKEMNDRLKKEARRSEDSFAKMYRVWGVPDVDEHPKLSEAMQVAKENGLNIAISNPCFEVWALLHFGEQNAPMHRHQAQKKLEDVMPRYSHDKNPVLDFEVLKPRYNEAVKNAKRGLDSRASEGIEAGNPSSNVFELMEEIRKGPDVG